MLTRADVIKAFREVASEEFELIPEEKDIDYDFSESFIRKTEMLIERNKCRNAGVTLNRKRVASALIAAVIMLFLGIVSVAAIREPVVDFFVKRFEGFDEVSFEGETSEKIKYVYSFSEVPKGFSETHRISNGKTNIVQYQNSETGSIIELCQTATYDTSLLLDNESGTVSTFNINNNKVCIYMNDLNSQARSDYYYAFWICGEDSVSLTYSGVASIYEIVEIIKTVE